MDWCLWTAGVGSVYLLAGGAAILLSFVMAGVIDGSWPSFAHALGHWIAPALIPGLCLLAADIAMGCTLAKHAPSVEITRRSAWLIWIVGMNGSLAALVGIALLLGGALR